MKILSTNIATPTTFNWNGREVSTGIYKKPTEDPIYLTRNDVLHDEVSDRLHHGGFYKACYLFSAEQYPYWQEKYPDLDWSWGMFGENLTISDFDERSVALGEIYQIGEAVVQISQYREPCFKLGHKFGTPQMIKQFIQHGFGGTYVSILEEGHVRVGDEFKLLERPKESVSVYDLFKLVFDDEKNQNHLKIAVASKAIPQKKRLLLSKFIK